MTVKSIIDIDVNDRNFRAFQQLLNQYQRQLQSTPTAWRNIAQAQQRGVKGFQDLVREQATAIGQQRLLAQANEAANRMLRTNADRWRDIRRETASVAVNIRDMTGQLLKWTALTGVFSGLLGAGGLFGVSRLAEGVATGRRSALGVGAGYGQQSAFANAFGRLVDPGSFLGGVEGALTDVSKRVSLYNAGLTEGQLGGGSAAVGSRLLSSIKRIADQTPDNVLGNVFRARGIDQFMSEDDFRRLKRTGADELSGLQRRFGAGSQAYDVSGRDQRAYQEFVTALDDASRRIETVFVRGLAPLIPGMEKLSNSVVKTIEELVKAVPPDWGEKVGKGIETFGKYIGSQEFQENVKNVAGAVIWAGKKLVGFGAWATGNASPGSGNSSAAGNTGATGLFGQQPETTGQAKFNRYMNSILGLNKKADAGYVDPGLGSLASKIQSSVPGIKRFTSFNDAYHAGTNSAHADNRAFDLTIADPSKSAEVAAAIRKVMADEGIKGKVIDEYKNPSSRATAGHIHVQTDVRVMNAAGSNVIVSAQQATVP